MFYLGNSDTKSYFIKSFTLSVGEEISADIVITYDFITISLKSNRDTKNIVFDKEKIAKDLEGNYDIKVYMKNMKLYIEALKEFEDISFPLVIDVK